MGTAARMTRVRATAKNAFTVPTSTAPPSQLTAPLHRKRMENTCYTLWSTLTSSLLLVFPSLTSSVLLVFPSLLPSTLFDDHYVSVKLTFGPAHVVSRDLVSRDLVLGCDGCHDPVLTFDTVPLMVFKSSGKNALEKHEYEIQSTSLHACSRTDGGQSRAIVGFFYKSDGWTENKS